MDHFLSFDVSLIIPKNIRKVTYMDFTPITTYICGYSPYSHVHRDVWIIQILLEHSLTWIQLIWLLAFHMPLDRMDSTFHCPLWSYIRNHWDIESRGEIRENWEYRNYSPLLPKLYLSLHPFVPLEHCCVLPNISFSNELAIERWRIEVVEAQVGDSVSLIRIRAVRGCI